MLPEPVLTDPPPTAPTHHRRATVAELGEALRALAEAAVRTGASDQVLDQVAERAHELTALLAVNPRTRQQVPEIDEFPGGIRMYSPATGPGSPLAPPMRVQTSPQATMGTCVLGLAHEGPPGYGHGGVTAMLLDELMGWACTAAGTPALTVDLHLAYQQPVPLQTPLQLRAHVTRQEGRKLFVHGTVTTVADPATTLVDADAVFLAPATDQAQALFPALRAGR